MRVSSASCLALLASLQVPVPPPPPLGGRAQELPAPQIEDKYGPLQVVELSRIADGGRAYHRRLVLTRGVVRHLVRGRYLLLEDGSAKVMLIPLENGTYDDYAAMLDVDVDVTGIVRVLPGREPTVPCRGERVPQSKCEDWDLPVLPDAQPHWPSVSLTIVRMVDRGTSGRVGAETPLRESRATLLGQFRGANLCRDLPAETRRHPADWVLLTPDGPVWVAGRRPAGRGFDLDPAHPGDTSRWLEVSGKVEVVGGARYLKAAKVALIARPKETEVTPCPP